MPTIEERAREALNAVSRERDDYARWDASDTREDTIAIETVCRLIEEFDAFKQDVSDALHEYFGELTEPDEIAVFGRFILPKPDPLIYLAREMVLLDGVVRTDSQKAAIREGRAANTAADDFYDRLRTALPARGLKLVEVLTMLTDEQKAAGWIEHDGGPCPVPPDRKVDYVMRCETVKNHKRVSEEASNIEWAWEGKDHDIIAYRLENTND